MDQLSSFSEYTLEEDKNLPEDSVDFSTLPKSGPYTELQIPQIWARCNTPRLRGQEVDGASAQTERYRGSWTPAKSLQIPPDVNTTQSIE